MFNTVLPYRLVQVKRNRFPLVESYLKEFIYTFYSQNRKACIKYVVSVKTYEGGLMTLDFYPKAGVAKTNALNQDIRYRLLTKQNAFGAIGGTILNIMDDMTARTGNTVWGFLAANLPDEMTNINNKRAKVYLEILRRTFTRKAQVFANKTNSTIFVVPSEIAGNIDNIMIQYEQIFTETN